MHSGKCDSFLRIYLRRCLAVSVFKLDDWNQMHFGQHILLNISTTSCLFLKFEKCLGKYVFRQMRQSPQNLLAMSSRSFAFQVGWLKPDAFWPTHFVEYLNNLMSVLEVWKCLGKNVFMQMQLTPQNLLATSSRSFGIQVRWLEPDAFWPTHFVEYLNDLMSVLEVWKCLGKYAFRRMRLFPQKLVATSSRDFDFKLDDWNQMHFGRNILLNISMTSCLFLKFESVLESTSQCGK